VQVTAYGRQTVHDRDVVRTFDPLKILGLQSYITGKAKPKVVKFCTHVGYINSSNRMTYHQQKERHGYDHVTVLKFCRLSWCSAPRGFVSDSWATCVCNAFETYNCYPRTPIGKVWMYRLLLVCVCTTEDFSAEDKASGVQFCTVFHRHPGQWISHFWKFAPPEALPEAQNRTNRPVLYVVKRWSRSTRLTYAEPS